MYLDLCSLCQIATLKQELISHWTEINGNQLMPATVLNLWFVKNVDRCKTTGMVP